MSHSKQKLKKGLLEIESIAASEKAGKGIKFLSVVTPLHMKHLLCITSN